MDSATTSDDSRAVSERVRTHTAFVEARAAALWRWVGRWGVVTFEELRGFGLEGLFAAARSYDPARGVPFRCWAEPHVRGAMLDGIRQWGCISVAEWRTVRAELEREGAGAARVADLVAVSHVIPSAASHVQREREEVAAENPEELLERAQVRRQVQEAVASLPRSQRSVVERVDFEGASLREAAASEGVSKPWASRLRARAFARLSVAMRDVA